MMNRDMIMFKLGAMSDQELLEGFSNCPSMQTGRQDMQGFHLSKDEDPENVVKNWADLKIESGGDGRGKLTDKNFMVNKRDPVLVTKGGMPHDSAEGAYDASPGSF